MRDSIKSIFKKNIFIVIGVAILIPFNVNATFFEHSNDTRLAVANLKINELRAELKAFRETSEKYNKGFEDRNIVESQEMRSKSKLKRGIRHLSGKLKVKYFEESEVVRACIGNGDDINIEVVKSCSLDYVEGFDKLLKPVIANAIALGYIKGYSMAKRENANSLMKELLKQDVGIKIDK